MSGLMLRRGRIFGCMVCVLVLVAAELPVWMVILSMHKMCSDPSTVANVCRNWSMTSFAASCDSRVLSYRLILIFYHQFSHPNSVQIFHTRYCAKCMTGKKVRVFWPVDSQWYIADVQQYDANTGEHLLRYPDGDTEWVRIGEDHTTNAQYKEYFSSLKNGGDGAAVAEGKLTRLPSLGNGVSFALSAMSQSFGLHTNADDETTARLKTGPSTSNSVSSNS